MRRSLLCCLLAASAVLAEESAERGAKEIFFSESRTLVSGLRRPTPTPPPKATPPPRTTPPSGRREEPIKEPPVAIAVGLRYWVELLQRSPRDPGRPVATDWTFRSGDRVRLHFESNVPGHIALYQIGSSGAASLLYPDPSAGQIGLPLAPHKPCVIPEGEAWFRFDSRPGVEQLLVVFASRREQLEGLKLTPRMSPSETNELRKATLAMKGSKDLVLETERQVASEVGTFAISLAGEAIVLPIDLLHE